MSTCEKEENPCQGPQGSAEATVLQLVSNSGAAAGWWLVAKVDGADKDIIICYSVIEKEDQK